jgi:hypothetical protein
MKRLIILVIAISLVGSFAFAENTGDITQTGDHNDADAVQTGDNEALVEQIGDYQTATVDQDGINKGKVWQLNGKRNIADMDQNGDNNKAYIMQGMTEGYMTGYYSVNANFNDATINQTGNRNWAALLQYGGSNNNNGNIGEITQNGKRNHVFADQGDAYHGNSFDHAIPNNYEHAYQSYNSELTIEQINDDNHVEYYQYGGDNNDAIIRQDGNSNFTKIHQGFLFVKNAPDGNPNYTFNTPVTNTKNNDVNVNQVGDNNTAGLLQLGDNNSFQLSQSGSGNKVGFYEEEEGEGPEGRRNAYFHQDGDNNQFAGVTESGIFIAGWDAKQHNGAVLDSESEGIEGYYGSFQQGDGNKIGLRQYNDKALIQQLGNNNTSTLWQQGAGTNEATMLQNGNNNNASLIQK